MFGIGDWFRKRSAAESAKLKGRIRRALVGGRFLTIAELRIVLGASYGAVAAAVIEMIRDGELRGAGEPTGAWVRMYGLKDGEPNA